ncbi:hypothetical protein AM571_CH01460 [Rhizobium etli 8C-3]|uniref:Uncharacterized protein n=1 Tax=Rhizobium etli 8C-3 TaxID=538025 RepID=A0A1L5P2D3_RHIET|nr:hypothetical protein AM571_CH01460 [Rhizobium etli 8C-3]
MSYEFLKGRCSVMAARMVKERIKNFWWDFGGTFCTSWRFSVYFVPFLFCGTIFSLAPKNPKD